jgi:hypothetical protein
MRRHVLGGDDNLMCHNEVRKFVISIPSLSLFMIKHRVSLVRAEVRTPVVLALLLRHSDGGGVGPL